jgi:glycosyltransferase involved in cell wall biosynthesis
MEKAEATKIDEEDFALIIPAYNEEESIGILISEIRSIYPDIEIIVISDGSTDNTAKIAYESGVTVLDLPCNLGVGGAVQTGMRYAVELGYETVVRIDGDGQHNPGEISRLLRAMKISGADFVTGSRFLNHGDVQGSTKMRRIGNILLACFLSLICRKRITDPTSGFWCTRGKLLKYFSLYYPSEYPEPEALALLRRQGYDMIEEAIDVRPRKYGVSSINSLGTIYFAMRVSLALMADRVRPVDRRYAKFGDERRLKNAT